MQSNYDYVIIGGGIVGLSVAYNLLKQQPKIKLAVLEKENDICKHQTGHNSGVIHSGIYYKPGSKKAVNCVEGYHLLLAFCQQNEIPYELCGKLIVATAPEEISTLNMLYERGMQNGLSGLQKMSPEEMREKEPHLRGLEGIFVPQTGIVNYRRVARKLADFVLDAGGEIHLNSRVVNLEVHTAFINIAIEGKTSLGSKLVINCGGLYSDEIAAMTESIEDKIVPFRGEYYEIKETKKHLVKNLIYPVPDVNFPFLGVHFTRRITGEIEAGPNAVLAYRKEGYRKTDVDLKEFVSYFFYPGFRKVAARYWKTGLKELYRSYSKRAFTAELQKFIPEIQEEDLIQSGAGVRAQMCSKNGGLIDDFLLVKKDRLLHVLNAPSPAATASLSIGKQICNWITN